MAHRYIYCLHMPIYSLLTYASCSKASRILTTKGLNQVTRFILILSCINGLLRNIHDYEITTSTSLTDDHHIYISTPIKYLAPAVLVNGYLVMAVTVCPLNTVFHYGRFEDRAFERQSQYTQIGLLL